MSTDKSLTTLLRALQRPSNDHDSSRLLGSGTTLLTLLSNPLNITLLTSQMLFAPAIWQTENGLQASLRVLSVFNAASVHILQRELDQETQGFVARDVLSKEAWLKSVIKGVDEKSPRWRHMLVLGGLLIGFENQDRKTLPGDLRTTLGDALVKATNLALVETTPKQELVTGSIALVLSHVFDFLVDREKRQINHDLLIQGLIRSPFLSREGLHWGYFLGTMDPDVVQSSEKNFNWSSKSSTFFQIQRLASSPLVVALGPLSRLTAFSIGCVTDINQLIVMIEDMSEFTRCLSVQWRQNKLSELDAAEEDDFLAEETLKTTLPVLWQVLRSTLFAIVISLRSLLGRVLADWRLAVCKAPFLAVHTLHVLRNLYFISSRLGHGAFTQYSFVNFTAIDILSNYPDQVKAFLHDIKPTRFGRIPPNPLDRCHDLYFLNTAEHFTLVVNPEDCEGLLIGAATPYLSTGSDPRLLEIFEAAHSVMLAVFATPQNISLVEKYLPFYTETLFKAFPNNLSPRQFRVAVRTLVRIIAPPSPIANTQPLSISILLELVRARAIECSTETHAISPPRHLEVQGSAVEAEAALSEQALMILTLIDCLPFLPTNVLEEWLPLIADSMSTVKDQDMLHKCKERFWDVLSNGEMDVPRAAICVQYWHTDGGRETSLFGSEGKTHKPLMSGALDSTSKL